MILELPSEMGSMSDLKPCPFCGREAHLSNWTDQAYVWCECGVKTEVYLHSGCVDKAIEAWNRRAEPERTAKVKDFGHPCGAYGYCSNCNGYCVNEEPYCPHCGARLEWE